MFSRFRCLKAQLAFNILNSYFVLVWWTFCIIIRRFGCEMGLRSVFDIPRNLKWPFSHPTSDFRVNLLEIEIRSKYINILSRNDQKFIRSERVSIRLINIFFLKEGLPISFHRNYLAIGSQLFRQFFSSYFSYTTEINDLIVAKMHKNLTIRLIKLQFNRWMFKY